MLKNDVIKRLDELQGCEKIDFIMDDGIVRTVYTADIQNFVDDEVIETPSTSFKCFYCSISKIIPHQDF